MSFTQSNIQRGVAGDCYTYSGTFTSAAGDNTLTVTHGMNNIRDDRVVLDGALGAVAAKVSHSGGVCTATWDDTMGFSGSFFFIGK